MSKRLRQTVPNYLSLKVCDELFALIANQADAEGVPMIDIAVRLLAKAYKRPDLGFVPRKPLGRKRRKQIIATNGQ